MQMFIYNFLLVENPFEIMVTPVIELINAAVAPMLGLVASLGTLYCIILGIKLAKAIEPQDQHKARDSLKNAIFGFILIFVLIVVLKIGIKPMTEWMNSVGGISMSSVGLTVKSTALN